MEIHLPKSLDEEIKFRREQARKLLEDVIGNSSEISEYPTEMGFDLHGEDNVVREIIFHHYSEDFSSQIEGIKERILYEAMESKRKCKFDKIAELHTHTTSQLQMGRDLIDFYPDVHKALPNIPEGSCSPDTACDISAYCFSLGDLKLFLEREKKGIEILYCELGKKYIAMDTPQMTMVDVVFY